MKCKICGNKIATHPIGGYWYHTEVSLGHIPEPLREVKKQPIQNTFDKISAQEQALRDLACYLGVGGYNDIGLCDFDAAEYVEKIKEGIQSFVSIEAERKK